MMVAGPSGVGNREARAPALLRRETAQRRGAGVKVGAERFRREQRAKRVLGHMHAGRAEDERQLAAENPRPHARAAVDRLDLDQPRVAIGAAAELEDARAARSGGLRQPFELRRVAVERRGAAGLEAEEDLGLGVGDRLDRAEMLDMDRARSSSPARHAGAPCA